MNREGWQCDEANLQRGEAWLGRLYKHNLQGTINNTLDANKDFGTIFPLLPFAQEERGE